MRFVRPPADISAQYRVIRVGQKRLSLLILRKRGGPAGEPQAPGVLWIHGGGYLMGMAEMAYKSRAIDLVREGAVVVTPEYTLSWRAPYPQALRECHAALRWLKEHARELSVRTDQIMVGGESAGGGLAAALCMYEKDHGGVNIAFQMPLYPMIDCYDTDSSRDNHERVWNTRRNHIAWRVYLRGLPAKGRTPVYASPARRKDLRGMPPCYTFVGDIDPFYCEMPARTCMRASTTPTTGWSRRPKVRKRRRQYSWSSSGRPAGRCGRLRQTCGEMRPGNPKTGEYNA